MGCAEPSPAESTRGPCSYSRRLRGTEPMAGMATPCRAVPCHVQRQGACTEPSAWPGLALRHVASAGTRTTGVRGYADAGRQSELCQQSWQLPLMSAVPSRASPQACPVRAGRPVAGRWPSGWGRPGRGHMTTGACNNAGSTLTRSVRTKIIIMACISHVIQLQLHYKAGDPTTTRVVTTT